MSQPKTEQTPEVQHSTAPKFKVLKQLTLPIFSLAHTPALTIMAMGEPAEADFTVEMTGKQGSKPIILRVQNMETGEVGLLICSAIMTSAFERSGGPLKGRYFKLVATGIREGKKYRDVQISELTLA